MLPFRSSELATRNFEGSSTASLSEQHSLPVSIGLHLLPGALTAIVFFTVAPFVQRSHLPPFVALCAANLTILPLFIFGFLYYRGYKRNGLLFLQGIVLYRQKVRWWEYMLFVPIVFFSGPLLILSLSPVTQTIYHGLFSRWPAMYDLAAG